MGKNERTGKPIGSIASRGLRNPASLSNRQIRTLAAAARTQRPDKRPPRKPKPK